MSAETPHRARAKYIKVVATITAAAGAVLASLYFIAQPPRMAFLALATSSYNASGSNDEIKRTYVLPLSIMKVQKIAEGELNPKGFVTELWHGGMTLENRDSRVAVRLTPGAIVRREFDIDTTDEITNADPNWTTVEVFYPGTFLRWTLLKAGFP